MTVSLKDATNYVWEDETSDDLTFVFTIEKAQIEVTDNTEDVTYRYNGQPHGLEVNISGENIVIRFANADDEYVLEDSPTFVDEGVYEVKYQIYATLESIKMLFTRQVSFEEVSGPVGVVDAISDAAEESESVKDAIFNLLYMSSLITINVGIFNLLPIPGLDGGRLLFCLIELIRRKPVKPEHEGYVHLAGMLLLFGIMIFATYNDIARLIHGG